MKGLAAETRSAGDGLVRLLSGAPGWAERFRFTTRGFVHSFSAPLLALPLAVVDVAVYAHAADGAAPASVLWSGALAYVLDAFGFPLLLALIAGPLRFKAGYAAFVIVNNWATLYLNLALTAAAALTLLGSSGVALFNVVALLLLCLSVALVWRIGRETLTRELAPLVLLVVLSVAWSTAAEQACHLLLGA